MVTLSETVRDVAEKQAALAFTDQSCYTVVFGPSAFWGRFTGDNDPDLDYFFMCGSFLFEPPSSERTIGIRYDAVIAISQGERPDGC